MNLNMIVPVLRIFDELKAKEFYLDFLGFRLDWEHRIEENTPLYIQISKDDCCIHLTEHHGDSSAGTTVRIAMTDIDIYQSQLLTKNYKYARTAVEKMAWGTKDMIVNDPFGNKLIFSE